MEFMDARGKRLKNKRRRIDEVHTSETEGAKKLRLERSCERAALEHLAEPDKAKKLRLEKRRDRYAAGRSAETDGPKKLRLEKRRDRYAAGRSAGTDGAKKLRKSYDMGLTTHSLSAPFTSRPIPNNHTISLPNMGSLSIYGQSVCQRSNIPHIWAQNEPDPYICVRGLTVPIYG